MSCSLVHTQSPPVSRLLRADGDGQHMGRRISFLSFSHSLTITWSVPAVFSS